MFGGSSGKWKEVGGSVGRLVGGSVVGRLVVGCFNQTRFQGFVLLGCFREVRHVYFLQHARIRNCVN